MEQLSKEVKVTLLKAATADGTSDAAGTALDMSGYEGVMFVSTIATANAGNFLKAQEGDTSSPTADLTGSKVTADNGADTVILDVHHPLKRYIRPVIVRAGASTVVGEIWAIQYKARRLPQENDVLNSTNVVGLISPVAGTP